MESGSLLRVESTYFGAEQAETVSVIADTMTRVIPERIADKYFMIILSPFFF
jgi:hypothetical protein